MHYKYTQAHRLYIEYTTYNFTILHIKYYVTMCVYTHTHIIHKMLFFHRWLYVISVSVLRCKAEQVGKILKIYINNLNF